MAAWNWEGGDHFSKSHHHREEQCRDDAIGDEETCGACVLERLGDTEEETSTLLSASVHPPLCKSSSHDPSLLTITPPIAIIWLMSAHPTLMLTYGGASTAVAKSIPAP